jgi:hypothetical protein
MAQTPCRNSHANWEIRDQNNNMTATDNPERQRQAARAFWALAEANRLLWDAINDGRDIESVLTAETDWNAERGRDEVGVGMPRSTPTPRAIAREGW